MPIVVNKETGAFEDLDPTAAKAGVEGGSYAVALNDPEGNPVQASHENIAQLLSEGYTQPNNDQLTSLLNSSKYGTTGQVALTALERGLSGATMGASDVALKKLNPDVYEASKIREEVNPTATAIAGPTGMVVSSLVGPLSAISKGVGSLMGASKIAATAPLATRAWQAAKTEALVNTIQASGEEASKHIINDPEAAAGGSALAHIGLAGLAGGILGGAFPYVGAGVKAVASKTKDIGKRAFIKTAQLAAGRSSKEVAEEAAESGAVDAAFQSAAKEAPDAASPLGDAVAEAGGTEASPIIEASQPATPSTTVMGDAAEDVPHTNPFTEGPADIPIDKRHQEIFDTLKSGPTTEANQILADMRAQLAARANNMEASEQVQEQLSNFYKTTTEHADDQFGWGGFKGKAIAGSVPELNTAINDQTASIYETLDNMAKKMNKNPRNYPAHLRNQFNNIVTDFSEVASNPEATSAELFNAINKVKQAAQKYGMTYTDAVNPAHSFVSDMRGLGHGLKEQLVDAGVWGKAASMQKRINEQFVKFKDKRKYFESKFTTQVPLADGGVERVVDPGKVDAFFRNKDKSSKKLVKDQLIEFMGEGQRYRDMIHNAHLELGMESPVEPAATNAIKAAVKAKNIGSDLADALLDSIAPGPPMGLAANIPGAWVAQKAAKGALAMVLKKLMPVVADGVTKEVPDIAALRASAKFVEAVEKGEAKMTSAASALVNPDPTEHPNVKIPTAAQVDHMRRKLDAVASNPAAMLEMKQKISHYMPNAAAAMVMVASSAITDLTDSNPERNQQPRSLMDAPSTQTKSQKDKYTRRLQVVMQPMVLLNGIKTGDITREDMAIAEKVHPAFVSRMREKLISEVTSPKFNPVKLTARHKLGLSIFLGAPMVSSLKPENMMAIQEALTKQSVDAPQQVRPSVGKTTQSGLNKLGKTNSLYGTPSQNAAARKVVH
jgi:hypothetical protein